MSLNSIASWHRWAGLSVALFVVVLCITGILLNHSGALGLAQRFIASEWLLDLYDIAPAESPVSYAVGEHHITRVGPRIYFDNKELPERSAGLLGAVLLQDQIVAALSDRLLILTPEGQTIEVLREAEGVPLDMNRIGIATDGRLAIGAGRGLLFPDLDSLGWEQGEAVNVNWAESAPPPAKLTATLLRDFRRDALTLERVLLDIHSGRIVNRFGVWFMDMIALALISLVLSGLWIWYRR